MCLYRRCSSHFLGAVVFIVFISFFCRETAVADWKQRLINEAPSKWEALEQYYSKLDVSYRKTLATPQEGKPFPWTFRGTVHVDLRKDGEKLVCLTHHVGKSKDGKRHDTTRVDGVNSRYAFKLAKASPDAGSFVLTNFQPATGEVRRKVQMRGRGEFDMIFTVQGRRLSDIIKDPLYTISAQGVQREEKELVKMEYDRQLIHWNRKEGTQKGTSPVEHGTVILDPAHYWCVLEFHFDNPSWIGDGTIEYGNEADDFPIPRRCKYVAKNKKGYGNQLITYEFDKIVHRDIPENEFMLSAFGLPEVQVPGEQHPRPLWRWLIGIGIALGVLAILLRLYVKKRNAMQRS